MKRTSYFLAGLAVILMGVLVAPSAFAASGDSIKWRTSTDFVGKTNLCSEVEGFFRYIDDSTEQYGSGTVWTSNPGGGCVVKSRARYVTRDGKGHWTAWGIQTQTGKYALAAFNNGKRCWSEHALKRKDGSYFTVRLFAPSPRSGSCDT